MRIQVVLNQHDLFSIREVDVGEIAQDFRKVDGGAPLGNLDMTPAFQWRQQHEESGCPVALVLVVVPRRLSRLHRFWRARLGDELLQSFVETDQRARQIVRPRVKLGTLAISAMEKNETCDGGIFDPLNLAKGIEGPADDRLFTERQPAYAISIGQRL